MKNIFNIPLYTHNKMSTYACIIALQNYIKSKYFKITPNVVITKDINGEKISGGGEVSSDINGNLFMAGNGKSFDDLQLDSHDFGKGWTLSANKTNSNFYSVATSSSGQYQTTADYVYGKIYTSSDYGVNWILSATKSGSQFRGVTMSSSGQYQTIVDISGNIYTSSDYGMTWDHTCIFINNMFYDVAMSSSGQYQTTVSNNTGDIYISSNYGQTWILATTKTNVVFTSISMSSSGQYQTAGLNGDVEDNIYVYTSSDYGLTWLKTGTETGLVIGTSMSASGKYQTIVGSGNIYTSSNYGQTWTMNFTSEDNLTGISMTSSGQLQTAISYFGNIYRSTNYGASWTLSTNNGNNLFGIAFSSSGEYQVVVSCFYDDGNIFICKSPVHFEGVNVESNISLGTTNPVYAYKYVTQTGILNLQDINDGGETTIVINYIVYSNGSNITYANETTFTPISGKIYMFTTIGLIGGFPNYTYVILK